jgi:hypothetical protein
MAEHVRVREIDDDEGRRLLRIVRRDSGSAVTWRRAQMVLLSAQGMPAAKIAEVTFTSRTGSATSSATSTTTGSARYAPATPAAVRGSSRCPSGGRSRRPRSPVPVGVPECLAPEL